VSGHGLCALRNEGCTERSVCPRPPDSATRQSINARSARHLARPRRWSADGGLEAEETCPLLIYSPAGSAAVFLLLARQEPGRLSHGIAHVAFRTAGGEISHQPERPRVGLVGERTTKGRLLGRVARELPPIGLLAPFSLLKEAADRSADTIAVTHD
jgi:hypothetical protein